MRTLSSLGHPPFSRSLGCCHLKVDLTPTSRTQAIVDWRDTLRATAEMEPASELPREINAGHGPCMGGALAPQAMAGLGWRSRGLTGGVEDRRGPEQG